MTISNQPIGSVPRGGKEGGDLSADPDSLASQAAVPAGLPDPAVLQRMANEFFRAIPGSDHAGSTLPDVQRYASSADVSSLTLPSVARLPAVADVSGVPAKVPHPATVSKAADLPGMPASGIVSPSLTAPGSIPGFPGSAGTSDFNSIPGFGFLSDVRTLFQSPPAGSIHAGPLLDTTKIPAVPGVAQATSALPDAGRFGSADVSSLVLPSIPRLPDTSDLSGLPAKAPHRATLSKIADVPGMPATGIVSPSITAPSSISGFPASADASNFDSVPGFGFLSESRSLFHSPPAAPIHAGPSLDTTKIPYESELGGNLPSSMPGAKLPAIPAYAGDAAAPQIPGASSHLTGFENGDPFGFLTELKSLEQIDTVPAAPANPQRDGFLTPTPVLRYSEEPDRMSKNPALRNTSEPASLEKSRLTTPVTGSAVPFSDVSSSSFDVHTLRRDFPILQERINGRPLIWLDNAATTQKPQAVIDRLSYFYAHENSNIHRAAHTLAARSTDAYEAAREKVRRFLNAGSVKEIIFVRGATEGVNLVAQSWGRRNIQKDDEIVITHLEHHANIVPWQMLCAEKGAKLRVAPVDDSGQVILEEYERLFNPRTKLAAFAHVSNALGTVTPIVEMTEIAHRHGARVLIDGAQSVAHSRVDMQQYDCDFFVFSGHKIFAPTGIGVVYGKADVLDHTPPWQGGGNMIADVTFDKTVYQPPPGRFEAGTGNIADAVGLGAALDYLDRVGMETIARYEHDLVVYATESLRRIPGLRLIGTAKEKASVLSFVLDGYRTEDVGAALNAEGIAVRSGHHCAQPILRRFGVESTVRPSLAFYNTCEEIDELIRVLWNLKQGRGAGIA